MIEVELRTFITKEKYDELLKKYKNKIEIEKQITYYYDCKQDFRLMKTKNYHQLWLKAGQIHDEARKEKIVKADNIYGNSLIEMLKALEFNIEIKWYRVRNKVKLDDNIEICIDFTEGYGYIFEIEKIVKDDNLVEKTKLELNDFLLKNKIAMCSKEQFKKKYEYYKNNWQKLTNHIDEEHFLR